MNHMAVKIERNNLEHKLIVDELVWLEKGIHLRYNEHNIVAINNIIGRRSGYGC